MADRILVSMKTYLGDAVMTAPLVDHLLASGWKLSLLTSDAAADVLGATQRQITTMDFNSGRRLSEIIRHSQVLKRERFHATLLVNHSFRSAVTASLARIPTRIGHPTEGRRIFLSHAIAYDPTQFHAAAVADLGEPLVDTPCHVLPQLYVSEEERAFGRDHIPRASVVIQPGARYQAKQLPPDTIFHIADQLQRRNHPIVLMGGIEESEEAAKLESRLSHPVFNLVGKTTIRETLGCLSAAQAAVGSDTGLMHLAAGTGCPTVQVFGPTLASKWGHNYSPHCVLQAAEGDLTRVEPEAILAAIFGALQKR